MKNILLLGATGSIGKSVLSVISQNKDKFNLIGISFNTNISIAQKIINDFLPKYVHIDDHDCFIKQTDNKNLSFMSGDSNLENLIKLDEVDIIVCATSGFAGLKAMHFAATTGKKILLANKATAMLHGEDAAQNSEQAAKEAFSGNTIGSNLPTVKIQSNTIEEKINIVDLVLLSKLENSKSEIRRLIKGSAVKINDDVISDEKFKINKNLFKDNYLKLSLGKKRHIKIELN